MSQPLPGPEAGFEDKWLAREPEMRLALVFVPAAWQARHRAWAALLHELRESLFELSDASVGAAKRAWWAEELLATERGAARHPLTRALPARLPWRDLAMTLPAGPGEDRHAEPDRTIAALVPLAEPVIAVEAALFSARAGHDASQALAVHWLLERMAVGLGSDDGGRLPMRLLARHGVTADQLAAQHSTAQHDTGRQGAAFGHPALREWSAILHSALPRDLSGGAPLRCQRLAFDRARLARLARGAGWPRRLDLATVFRAWTASRRAVQLARLD